MNGQRRRTAGWPSFTTQQDADDAVEGYADRVLQETDPIDIYRLHHDGSVDGYSDTEARMIGDAIVRRLVAGTIRVRR